MGWREPFCISIYMYRYIDIKPFLRFAIQLGDWSGEVSFIHIVILGSIKHFKAWQYPMKVLAFLRYSSFCKVKVLVSCKGMEHCLLYCKLHCVRERWSRILKARQGILYKSTINISSNNQQNVLGKCENDISTDNHEKNLFGASRNGYLISFLQPLSILIHCLTQTYLCTILARYSC